jgi:DNA-binding XRE family transcriptional regulator
MAMQPELLKAMRDHAGMSQGDLANAIGMSRGTISDMENGKAPIELRTELAVRYVVEKIAANFTNYLRNASPAAQAMAALEAAGRGVANRIDPEIAGSGAGVLSGRIGQTQASARSWDDVRSWDDLFEVLDQRYAKAAGL